MGEGREPFFSRQQNWQGSGDTETFPPFPSPQIVQTWRRRVEGDCTQQFCYLLENPGVPLWHSGLRIWHCQHCHCSSSGYCCGVGSISGWEIFMCSKCALLHLPKKKEKKILRGASWPYCRWFSLENVIAPHFEFQDLAAILGQKGKFQPKICYNTCIKAIWLHLE